MTFVDTEWETHISPRIVQPRPKLKLDTWYHICSRPTMPTNSLRNISTHGIFGTPHICDVSKLVPWSTYTHVYMPYSVTLFLRRHLYSSGMSTLFIVDSRTHTKKKTCVHKRLDCVLEFVNQCRVSNQTWWRRPIWPFGELQEFHFDNEHSFCMNYDNYDVIIGYWQSSCTNCVIHILWAMGAKPKEYVKRPIDLPM